MLCRPIRWVFLQLHLCLAILVLVGCAAFAQDITMDQQQASPQQRVSQTPAQSSQPAAPAEITQAPAKSVQPPSEKDAPELTTEDVDTTFRVRVNLVEVRVVVRDAKGQPVRGLKKEDFQLLDDGKPQVIKQFQQEDAGERPSIAHDSDIARSSEQASPPPRPAELPQQYVAYLFDDVHLNFDSLAKTRIAALEHLQNFPATNRAAIYTTSGQTQLDFTDDPSAVRAALNRLAPHPITSSVSSECPHLTYYMADMIENRGDSHALDAATYDVIDCAFGGKPAHGNTAENMARSAARQVVHLGDYEGRVALDMLRRVVQRLALMPGHRSIVLISPGFLNTNQLKQQSQLVEQALHSGVVINTLDSRGLYTLGDDASKYLPPRHPGVRWRDVDSNTVDGIYRNYIEQGKLAQADVLRGLAEDTGGTFFNNSNNLVPGFQAGIPEYSYLLAFSPSNMKLDGSFHNLRVTVQGSGLSVQARKGYYAANKNEDAAEQTKRELEEAVFSQQESHDIPVQLHTEFFKINDEDAKLSVLIRVDARSLRYRKIEGRNRNDVTVISALFDRNGRFISGTEKVLQMRLKDETLGSNLLSGLTLKTNFDVKTGSYLVRLVVRDDGGHLTAENDAVDIP